ncbi:MAG: 2-dehydropantoate 2-reductase [Zoogloea sp.]|uniref:ketopantoate reductase family protein n=1 Tax=Zoogloea sp. TaxID=49181 RepID=UPI002630ED8D|nr:2-dehydropantoate 2-reductase [Zoogloea sp.]MDD2988027.1 2-dehydropantoate 2-reductase [Zoogloea sp.]
MTTPCRYPLAIVGAGALGLHFAARLAAFGPVALVARNAARADALRAGVQVGSRLFVPEVFAPGALPEADWVILLVKTGDTAGAARTALALQPRGVLSLQNGLVEATLRAECGSLPVGQGITTEGAFHDGLRVQPAGAGETLLPPGFEAVVECLSAAGFRARTEPAIAAARLAKLLVNVAINPLAALFRVPNGALLEPPHRVLLEALVREAWPVLRTAGLDLDEGAALARVVAVATATAGNRASMLQDVLAGRRTEIDAITGTLLAMAEAGGVELPTHRAVFTLVRRLSQT